MVTRGTPSSSSGDSGHSGADARLDNGPESPKRPESRSSPLEDGIDLERMASVSLSEVIERIKKLLKLSSDIDYISLIIGVALSYVIDLLPSGSRIFYVGFVGSKGSGKSTATSFAARVAHKGKKLEAVTFSSLADACEKKFTLCLGEFDAQCKRCPELEAIVRQGIDLSSHYTRREQDSKGKWHSVDIPCGGMKFLNWRDDIDDALQQRILVIKMTPGATTRMIMNNEAPERFTSPMRTWFHAQAAIARTNWTQERVRKLIEDDGGSLERRLTNLAGVVPRQTQKAMWMLVVCEIFGWDLDSTIRELIAHQPEDDVYDDYKELVVEVYRQRMDVKRDDSPVSMNLLDFKSDVSERIKAKSLPPIHHKGRLSWTGLRRECGFVDGVNEYKDRKKSGKKVLVFDERVLRYLGISDSTQSALDGIGGAT